MAKAQGSIRHSFSLIFILLFCSLVIPCSAFGDEEEIPDAQKLLAQATAGVADKAVAISFEVQAFDGQGKKALWTLKTLTSQVGDNKKMVSNLRGNNKEYLYFWEGDFKSGQLHTLMGNKVKPVALKRSQTTIADSNLWAFDFIPVGGFSYSRIISGVNLNGAPCWLLAANYLDDKLKYQKTNVWISKKEKKLVQINWLDKKSWPARQMNFYYETDAESEAALKQIMVRDQGRGTWTELKIKDYQLLEAFSAETLTADILVDRSKLDSLWPSK